jgi:hypothetical protein
MKTAMQELIELIVNNKIRLDIIEKNQEMWLEKEKEQMIGCCLVGYLFEDNEDTNPFELAEKFYNQTYNQTNVGNDGFEFDNSSTIPPPKTNNL